MKDVRVGDAERGHVVELLGRAVAQGYLSLEEYEQRLVAATSARRISELHGQLSDLPAQFEWNPSVAPAAAQALAPTFGVAPHGAQPTESEARVVAGAALALGIASIPLSLCGVGAFFGIAALVLGLRSRRGGTLQSYGIVGATLGVAGLLMSLGFVSLWLFGVAG